jgi:hypothetical protein
VIAVQITAVILTKEAMARFERRVEDVLSVLPPRIKKYYIQPFLAGLRPDRKLEQEIGGRFGTVPPVQLNRNREHSPRLD